MPSSRGRTTPRPPDRTPVAGGSRRRDGEGSGTPVHGSEMRRRPDDVVVRQAVVAVARFGRRTFRNGGGSVRNGAGPFEPVAVPDRTGGYPFRTDNASVPPSVVTSQSTRLPRVTAPTAPSIAGSRSRSTRPATWEFRPLASRAGPRDGPVSVAPVRRVPASRRRDQSSSVLRLLWEGPPEKTNSCSASVSKRLRMSPSGLP